MTKRFESIDSLRGIAALLVVWLHVCEVFATVPGIAIHGLALHEVSNTFGFGRVGVVAFFAISGYVICPTISGSVMNGTRVFLIKRLFRLLPAFWFAMLACWFSSWYLRGIPIDTVTVLSNATMLASIFGEPFIQGHFWTLEIELVFYALVIILFLFGVHQSPLTLLAIVLFGVSMLALIILQVAPKIENHWSFSSYFIAIMCWGALIRIWQGGKQSMVRFIGNEFDLRYFVAIATLAVFSPIFYTALRWLLTGNHEALSTTLSFGIGMLLFIVFAFVRNLHSTFLVWTGKVSYSVYLLHPAVFYTLYYLVKKYPVHPLSNLHLSAYLISTTLLTLLLSECVYRLIENPANQFARATLNSEAKEFVKNH